MFLLTRPARSVFSAIACSSFVSVVVAVDPPFNAEFELRGSAVFNSEDWHINGTGAEPNDAKVGLAAEGLVFTLDGDSASKPSIQFKRNVLVGDGVTWAWFRIRIDDVDNVGFYLGLYSEESNPKVNEPAYAAYFRKGETDTQVDLRTRDDDDGNTVADQFTVSDNVPFDLVIKIDPSAANPVTFYWRNSPTGDWDEEGVSTSVPDSTTVGLHYSMLVFNDDALGTSAMLIAEVFEHEAPTRD